MSEARDRWEAMSARERGALLRAVRRGDEVADPDKPLAAEIARRELARLDRQVTPRRVRVWRALQLFVAVIVAIGAVRAANDGSWLAAGWYAVVAATIGSSVLLAGRRLTRQVDRLEQARERNASHGTPATV